MVRVAGLKGQQLLGVEERSADGLTPAQQLAAIAARGRRADRQPAGGLDRPRARARARPASRCSAATRSTREDRRPGSTSHFREQIFPVLTPQAIDPAHPFPFIPNKGFSLIFDLKRLSDGEPIRELLMVPDDAAALHPLPGRGGALHRDRDADPPPDRTRCSPATRCSAAARSASSATATSRSRRKPRIWSAIFRSAIKRRRRGRVIRLEARGRHARRARRAGPRGPRRQRGAGRSNRPASSASPTSRRWSRRTGPTSNSRRSRRAFPSGSANMAAIASPRSAPRTSSSTTPMRASTSCSPSCARRPRIPTSSRSSRRSTAPASSRR